MLSISQLTEDTRPLWDEYVDQATGGLPQQLSGWQTVLKQTYGYKTHYLMAQEGSLVVGVLPLFIVNSYLTGKVAMTMPGAICADDENIARELIKTGIRMARRNRTKRFHLLDSRRAWDAGLKNVSRHVHWLLNTQADPDTLWKRLHSNVRRQVRIAKRSDLSVTIDRKGQELETFYNVFSRFAHAMGTPVFSFKFLQNVVSAFPNRFNIAVVRLDNQPIGAYFQLEMKRTVHGVWGATLRDYLKLRPVYLAYWEMLKYASEQGFYYLDMGRSPVDSTIAKNKRQWGGEEHPIYQQVLNFKNPGATAETVQPQHRQSYALFTKVWQHIPLPMANYLGPKVRYHVPFA